MNTYTYIQFAIKFVRKDNTIKPTHLSVYLALIFLWQKNNRQNPISISRQEIMKISKINSNATYHKCLKKLNSLGIITYKPSFNPFKSSQIFLNKPLK
jgi:hypothetical protein